MKTMKLILFICINIASWCVYSTVNACTPWHYISFTPEHYRTFRISDWGSDTPWSDCFKNEDTYKLNCELWQKQTSRDIPLEDIYEVVINASLGHMKWLQEDIEKDSLTCFVNNQFAKWLFHKRDMDILRFLILAKKCEESNGQDTWCYDKDAESNVSLESLCRLALQAADDSRARGRDFLHDRYVLQAMRALFRVGKHKECTELWHKKRVIMQRNVIYNMTGSLAAGAYFRMGKNSTAVKLFMECDNMNEAMFCMSHAMPQDVVGRMEFIYSHFSTCQELTRLLEYIMRQFEWDVEYGLSPLERVKYVRLRKLASRIILEKKVEDPLIWLYANAILTERLEGVQQAKKILADGMKHCVSSSSLVEESVYIYKKYLDACTMKYFSEIEWLTFFKWLDDKIVAHKRNLDWYYLHYLKNNHSFCYYNDMMRKIVYAGLIPRLLEMKEGGLALLLANYADNRLLKLNKARETGVLNIPKGEFNPYDYSNESFRLLDTLPVDDLNKYRKLLVFKKWEGELVNFLYDKSYVNLEYLDDIIGTRYLREMNYQSACQYFKVVSNDYQERMNVAPYMNRDPFTAECENECAKTSDSVRYKLRFAEKMCKLEEQMKSEDKIEREKAACLYYWGIYNSHFSCWALTRYRDEIWRSNVSPAIEKLCIENVQLIIKNSRDAEVKAQCHWILAYIYSGSACYSGWRYHIGMLHRYDAIVKEVKEWTAHCDSYKMYEEN